MAWTLYGFRVSQFGDTDYKMEDGTLVKLFVKDYLGFKHDFYF